MKAIIIFFTIAFTLASYVNGQTYTIINNPTFDSVIVVTNNPTNNDSINFIIYISNELPGTVFFKFYDSLGNRIPNIKISNDSIYIYENSMGPFWDTTEIYIDTILFTNLNLSQYKILLINRSFALYTTCYECPLPLPICIDTAKFNLSSNIFINENGLKSNLSRIYPNPTSGIININIENIKNIFVVNQIGETVFKTEKTNEINLGNLPKGIYFIKVTNDKFVHFEKVIIQ